MGDEWADLCSLPVVSDLRASEGGLRVGCDSSKCHEGGDITFKGGLRVGRLFRPIPKGGLGRPITRSKVGWVPLVR